MEKKDVVAVLREIAVLLELSGENPFKSRAYENAARSLETDSDSLQDLIASGKLAAMRGIGKELLAKITALAETGTLPYYEELKASLPEGLLDLLQVPGLGPKKAKALFEQLGVTSLGELEYACNENRLVALKGFGERTQSKILEGIAFLKKNVGQFHYGRALPEALAVLEHLRGAPGLLRCDLAGSIRRKKEVVKDVDVLAAAKQSGPLTEHFLAFPGIEAVLGSGETKTSIRLASGLQVDLRVVTDEEYPYALHHFTGSREHNTAMRGRAKGMGLKMNEYGLWRGEKRVPCKSEEELFAALELAFIPPELREDTGEIDAAARDALPALVERGDIVGMLHVHTNYSDGKNRVAELRDACAERGLQYLLICDHSKSAAYAGGLSEARIREQHAEIDAANRGKSPVRVLKGIEADILADGSVDYDDDVLASFDLVIASVHSRFNLDEKTMTARICKALAHPRVHMLGHPTGRLLLARDGYALDIEQVLQTAKKHRKAIELNAHPYRLDLDWRHCKRAKELGVPISINPDAHDIEGLDDLDFGVAAARRGWLSKEDVLNAWPWKTVQERLGLG